MNTPRPRHYTLIELLVVIAIIMILSALIVPALRSARESAKKAQCLANQKNIGQYVHLYAQNNNNSLKALDDWHIWYRNLLEANGGFKAQYGKDSYSLPSNHYLSYYDEAKKQYISVTRCKKPEQLENHPLNDTGLAMAKVFVCPSDVSIKDDAGALASYGRNDPQVGGTMKYKAGSNIDGSKKEQAEQKPRLVESRLNDIRTPSDLILAADHWGKTFRPGESENSEEYNSNNVYHLRLREGDQSIGDLGGKRDDVSRHRGSPPILFVDGHITSSDWKATIPKRFHDLVKTYGEKDGLGWQGRAVGQWSDDPRVKK